MDKLRAMRLFVRVIDAGSFTAVADELNVTTSMNNKNQLLYFFVEHDHFPFS